MSEYATQHFALNRWILKWAGLWAPEFNSKKSMYLYRLYALVTFLCVYVYFLITEFMSLRDTYSNLDMLIKNINFVLTHVMGSLKSIFWFVKGKDLIGIMNTLQDEKFHYESCEGFRPGEISKKAKKTGLRYTFVFFMMAHVNLTSSYTPEILTAAISPKYIEDENGNRIFSQKLPYFSWIPFPYDTPGTYIIAAIYQFWLVYWYAYVIVGMDTLFMNIMNYISSQLLILKEAFRTIRQRSLINANPKSLTPAEVNSLMAKEMKKCSIHLQTVIEMSEKLESIHNLLTLGQTLATLFILCTSLYLVSTTPVGSKQFAGELIYMVSMSFQMVLYCWFGNEVTVAAEEIPLSIYEGEWLESDKSFRMSMMITMTRMMKPLYLTAGKFAPLTLTTFVAIMKGSYSFYAVLNTANE